MAEAPKQTSLLPTRNGQCSSEDHPEAGLDQVAGSLQIEHAVNSLSALVAESHERLVRSLLRLELIWSGLSGIGHAEREIVAYETVDAQDMLGA